MIWRDEPVRPVKVVYTFNIFLTTLDAPNFLEPKIRILLQVKQKRVYTRLLKIKQEYFLGKFKVKINQD